ncbi:MAG TPA: 3-hydroxyacyl-CoA dehydrogenase NAD-binding domain-containing protein [Conexibacter sp.]|nr:3-hydroxyacyl-CoA dehydrogenase NAD-binding domain-containing protein [Conexibacter sp.]
MPLPARLRRLPPARIALPRPLDTLDVRCAHDPLARLLGLAGLRTPPPDAGLLLTRTRSVHTFGMRFALDLVWLDRDGRVARVDRAVPPGRIRVCQAAHAVIEVPYCSRLPTFDQGAFKVEERLGIAGSGAIACGLAATAAQHGDVLLWARSDSSAERARGAVAKWCSKLSEEPIAERVTVVSELGELASATFLVEALAEERAVKDPVLAELGRVSGASAVLATTTSSLSVTELAAASGRPDRFVGLHVFNPVPKMALVELAYAPEAVEDVRERARALCATLGKTAVEVPDIAGFVVNRLLFPYLFSAVELMEQTGLAPSAIDDCMRLGAGHPMGPLALLDYVGLDVSKAIGEAIGSTVPKTVVDLVAEGHLGKKTGRGLHTY